ncbi:cadherin repeat domain-containing protein [Sessilibacter corallicola]|uniref:cadherin repeat domain-containing protein n=1 Tax=Sessilibacter corallicola TaxID=2904075 RepID=UPI001E4DF88B|nr:cadherin repeat domain-containing protein [Sessilibacter corallicola]MCE2030329.1 cadherin repeat domain-containing protein [Sessilibacter corallicola]
MRKLIYLTALTTTLVACGGGGGGGSDVPEFTSSASVTVLENRTATGYVATAVGSDEGGVTFSIVGGEDADSFSVDGTTGVLTFITPQNFEAPNDGNGNNSYLLTLQATDAEGNTSTLDLTVNVTNEFNLGITQTFPSVNANYGGVNEVVVTGLISDSESENNIIPMGAVESLTVNGVEVELDPQNPGAWAASIPADQTLRSLDISLTDANGNITEASQAVINIPAFGVVLETAYDEVSQQIYFIASSDDISPDVGFINSLWRFDIATATYEMISETEQNSDFSINDASNLILDSVNQRLIYQDDSVFPNTIRFVEVDLLTGNRTLFTDIPNDDTTDFSINSFVYDVLENLGYITKGAFSRQELYSIDFNLNVLSEVLDPDTNQVLSDVDDIGLDVESDRLYFLTSPGSLSNLNVLDIETNTLQRFSENRFRSNGRGNLFVDEARNRLVLDNFFDLALIDRLTGEIERLETIGVNNLFLQRGTFAYGASTNTSVAATSDGRFAQIGIDQEISDPLLENDGVITPFLPRSGSGDSIFSADLFFPDENDNLFAITSTGVFTIDIQNGNRSVVTTDFSNRTNTVVFDQDNNRFFGSSSDFLSGDDIADRFSVFDVASNTITVLSEISLSETDTVGNSPVTIGRRNRAALLNDVNRNRVIAPVINIRTTIRYFSIDTDTGERTPLFEALNTESNPLFGNDILYAFDQSGDVLLVSNGERDALYRFDLTTEELTLISSDMLGDGPVGVFTNQASMTTDFDNNRILIVSDNTIHAVDLTTGDRVVLVAPDESGPSYRSPGAVELSPDGERLFIYELSIGATISIHLASGQKTILSE